MTKSPRSCHNINNVDVSMYRLKFQGCLFPKAQSCFIEKILKTH